MSEQVNHPKHYGGEDSPYEVIKIAEHYNLDLYLFNLLKYSLRAGIKSKDTELQDLKKGLWYLQRKINRLEQKDLTINTESKKTKLLITNLKIGDYIKAIETRINEEGEYITKDKFYLIKYIGDEYLTIKDNFNSMAFYIKELDYFFHVTK